LRIEIESTKGLLLPKVEAEVGAFRVPRLPVEKIEVPHIVEVSEAVLNRLVAEIVVVCWKAFRRGGRSKRTRHDSVVAE
jgi:hypothetical protein